MAYHQKIIFLDAPTTNIDTDGNTTHSFSYSLPAGTVNRLVILCLCVIDNTISATFLPGASFNGSAMVNVTSAQNNDAADDSGSVIKAYSPVNLAAGSYTVSITYGANVDVSQAVIFTLDNVDHTVAGSGSPTHGGEISTPSTDADSGTGTSFASIDITTSVDRTVVIQAAGIQANTTITPTGGQTVLFNQAIGAGVNCGFVAYKEFETPGLVGFTMDATFSSADWANCAVAIKPYRRRSHAG